MKAKFGFPNFIEAIGNIESFSQEVFYECPPLYVTIAIVLDMLKDGVRCPRFWSRRRVLSECSREGYYVQDTKDRTEDTTMEEPAPLDQSKGDSVVPPLDDLTKFDAVAGEFGSKLNNMDSNKTNNDVGKVILLEVDAEKILAEIDESIKQLQSIKESILLEIK